MRPLIIAASALAVFFLALAVLISAGPAGAATTMDRCAMCHPQPHPDGWVQQGHALLTTSSPAEMQTCARCHTTSFCTACHAASGVGTPSSAATSSNSPTGQ